MDLALSNQIQKRTDELLADSMGASPEERELALSLNALPLYPDWSGHIAIRPDGSFLFRQEDASVQDDVEPEWQLVALIKGSRKYPELLPLLPRRSGDAADCVECEGTGHALLEGKVLDSVRCGKCFGLGWVDGKITALAEQARARLEREMLIIGRSGSTDRDSISARIAGRFRK